jgi:hypothetical protein
MPWKDKENQKEYNKQYYHKNKESCHRNTKKWRDKNKDKYKQQQKEYKKEYRQTPHGKKVTTIANWKKQKIIFHDWDLLYDIIYSLTSHCDECNVFLEGNGSNRKCLDHDHSITDADNVRNVLCNRCNIRRG